MTEQQLINLFRNDDLLSYGDSAYLVMSDGEPLSLREAKENTTEIMSAIADNDPTGGWLPIGVQINFDDMEMVCAHSGKRIPAAFE